MDNCPRVALSFNAVLKTSNSNQSCTGAVLVASNEFPLPVQSFQVFKPISGTALLVKAKIFVAFRKAVCHGVPRCTRPSQPAVGNLFVGKSQASEFAINESLYAKL